MRSSGILVLTGASVHTLDRRAAQGLTQQVPYLIHASDMRLDDFKGLAADISGYDDHGRSQIFRDRTLEREFRISKKREGHLILLLELLHFRIRIPRGNTQELRFPLEARIVLDNLMHRIQDRSVCLADRTEYVENYDNQAVGPDPIQGQFVFRVNAQVILLILIP